MRSPRALVLLVVVAIGCSADGGAPDAARDDAGVDAAVEPVSFTATADPSERTDCIASVPDGVAIAKHVTCAGELATGALAMGRVGDIVLANAHARFVVRTGTESASTIGGPSGGVVDASLDGSDDALKEIFPLVDFGVAEASDIVVTDAGGDADASVTVLFEITPLAILAAAAPGLSRAVPVRGAVTYTLHADRAVLDVDMQFSPVPGGHAVAAAPGLAALLGGNGALERPGFAEIPSAGGGSGIPGVISEGAAAATAIALDASSGTLVAVATIHLLSGERVSVAPGTTTTSHARIALGASAAEAWTLADPLTEPVLVIHGAAGDRAEIATSAGPYLRTRLEASGAARVPVPAGDVVVRAGFDTFFPGAPTMGTAGGEVTVARAPSATLHVEASVGGDANAPVRVTVRDRDSLDEVVRFVARGPTDHRLLTGTFIVQVSHGIEHDVHEETVTLADGDVRAVIPVLDHVVDTSGWIGCDFHLHSDLSTDSLHHVVDAVAAVAAEGLDLVASTDHDYLTDYGAITRALGVDDRVVVVPGVEVSSTVLGHFGGYPLARDTAHAGAGAPIWFDATPRQIFDAIEARGDATLGGALVQINHPRLRGTSFFDVIHLDPVTGHATGDPMALGLPVGTDLDDLSLVTAVEVWNGYTRGDNEAAFADYLGLTANGRRFTMVGNSDSHLATLPAGAPRTFLAVPDDTPGHYGWADAAAALRGHRATVAAGIFVTAELAGPATAGSVPVHVRVQAPPWVDTNRLRIWAGTEVAVDQALPSTGTLRLDATLDVPLGGARFVVVRADGGVDAEPVFPFHPFGVTNAIDVP